METQRLTNALLAAGDYATARGLLEAFREEGGTQEQWRAALRATCERGLVLLRLGTGNGPSAFLLLLLACRAGDIESAKVVLEMKGKGLLQQRVREAFHLPSPT